MADATQLPPQDGFVLEVDLSGRTPVMTYRPPTDAELEQHAADADAQAAADKAQAQADNDRQALKAKLEAGTATHADVQGALADLLGP